MSEFDHPNVTPYGYTLDAETLPDFITTTEFDNYTANKFKNDTRIAANIPSASEAIRNYCGWHISPNLVCGVNYRIWDLRDAFVGSDLLVQLPATYVTGITKIIVDAVLNSSTGEYEGEEWTDYDLSTNGTLRIYDVGARDKKCRIFIKYTAGFPNDKIAAIKELTADRVTHAVANPYGVNSEAAGGVSISYSGTWAGNTSATALANDAREVLDAYKVGGVF